MKKVNINWGSAFPLNFGKLSYPDQLRVMADAESEYNFKFDAVYSEAFAANQLPAAVVEFMLKTPDYSIGILQRYPVSTDLLIKALQLAEFELFSIFTAYSLVWHVTANESYNDDVEVEVKKYLARLLKFIEDTNNDILADLAERKASD